MSSTYPSRATITEVGLRDGLQMESQFDQTGIDLAALCDAARNLEQLLGRALPGQVMHAGPRLRRYLADEALCAAGS